MDLSLQTVLLSPGHIFPVIARDGGVLVRAGHTINSNDSVNDADVNVIWSVLFNGRMSPNKHIWSSCRKKNKPVIVLEVGGIKRGTTWKVGLNGINRDAEFGSNNMDSSRASEQGLLLKPWKSDGQFIKCMSKLHRFK